MANIFTETFETTPGYDNEEWDEVITPEEGHSIDPDAAIPGAPGVDLGDECLEIICGGGVGGVQTNYEGAWNEPIHYTRFYLYIDEHTLQDGEYVILARFGSGLTATIWQLRLGYVAAGSLTQIYIYYRKPDDGESYGESTRFTMSLDTWYCVEVKHDRTNSQYEFRVDENTIHSDGLLADRSLDALHFGSGDGGGDNNRTWTACFDALEIDDTDWVGALPPAGGEELEKSLGDTINLSDENIFNTGLNKADSINLSDEISKVTAFLRSLSDTVNLSDIRIGSYGLNKEDSISLADLITKAPGINRSDTINLSDEISKVIAFLRSLSDTINLSDENILNTGLNKSDTINLSDEISKVTAFLRSLSDTINLSDNISKQISILIADSISLSDDLVSAIISIILKLNDTITLSDEIYKVTSFLRSLSDTVTLSDSITKSVAFSKADTIDLSDIRIVGYGLNKEDSISLADLIIKTPGLSIADTIDLSDEKILNIALNKADTISLSDDMSRAAVFLRSLSDTISLSDDMLRAASFLRSLSDIILLSDYMSKDIICFAVTPDGRIIIVPVESRAMVVKSENRTVIVSAENRVITIDT